ncbi:PAAR-like domain-containing protein [Phyllobacterium sp. P30BS-XVII]|uniref:PAAR-like domain-containing protein n=1 Tax=Phyllobacterium sp. P30BS-XVII TaxID=2587046 RepID=UPI0013AE8954|nr:PAAR-like domain-containing protein [Phyllobacterium sp. P30BS-XVII]MBA8902423.1 hypothetical protein [Phyllobacterium sp. P30BS-XVII]
MQETVSINGITLCHKHSDGWVRSTLPDVCKAPTIPVPFTNIAFAKDLAKGTKTVFSHDGAMNGVKGSEFSVSIGDEPGVGGGVISGVNMHRATFLSWSLDVFMEGRNVTRLTDRMLLNKGNTISAGGYYTGLVKGASAKDLDELCEIACKCKPATLRQLCVANEIRKKFYDGKYPTNFNNGMCPEVSMIWDKAAGVWGIIMNKGGTAPTSNPMTPGGGIRPDVLCRTGGSNSMLVEMKFKGDTLSPRQKELYPQAAKDIGAKNETLDVEQDCDCSGGGGTAPAPVTAPSRAPKTSPNPAFPVPSEQVPGAWPWSDPRPAGDWCRPVAGAFGTTVYECIRGY